MNITAVSMTLHWTKSPNLNVNDEMTFTENVFRINHRFPAPKASSVLVVLISTCKTNPTLIVVNFLLFRWVSDCQIHKPRSSLLTWRIVYKFRLDKPINPSHKLKYRDAIGETEQGWAYGRVLHPGYLFSSFDEFHHFLDKRWPFYLIRHWQTNDW